MCEASVSVEWFNPSTKPKSPIRDARNGNELRQSQQASKSLHQLVRTHRGGRGLIELTVIEKIGEVHSGPEQCHDGIPGGAVAQAKKVQGPLLRDLNFPI